MRKVLSFVLVLAMILGSVSMAFAAPADVVGTDSEEAVNVLMEFGVVTGYSDGSFKPAGIVTRAEMAAFIIRALGLNPNAAAATQFADVPASHWASKYVVYAASLGIIFGRTATVFDPDATVSYDEAVTMLVRALGYTEASLIGTYPAAYVSKAKALGIIGDIQAGTAGANRGDIAQLVFNTLSCDIGKVDADNTWQISDPADTMMARLGAEDFTPINASAGALFVVIGDEESIISLKEYQGALVTAYANSDNEIISINEVKSVFVKGEVDAASGTATVGAIAKDDEIGDYTVKAGAYDFDLFEEFVNGENVTVTGAVDGNTYTFGVKVSGKYITEIYSAAKWDVTADAMIDDGDLDDIDDNELFGYEIPTDNNDDVDYTEFALYGVSALSDIEEDDVVYVYADTDNLISRIDVGQEVVAGTVSKITSTNSKATVGGTAYAVGDGNNAIANFAGLDAGDEVELYLDAAGDVYDYEITSSEADTLAILLDANVKASPALGETDSVFKLFLADGTTLTASVDDDDFSNANAAGIIGTTAGKITKGAIVYYGLDADGKINALELAEGGTVASDGGVKTAAAENITAKGYFDGLAIASDATIFTTTTLTGINAYPDKEELGVTTLANVLDTDNADAAYFYDSTVGKITWMVMEGGTSTVDIFAAYNGYAKVDSDAGYEVYTMVDGVATTYEAPSLAKANGATSAGITFYKLAFDTSGYISTYTTVTSGSALPGGDVPFVQSVASTGAVQSIKNNVVTATEGGVTISCTLDTDVVVYKWNSDDDEWVKGSVSSLRDTAFAAFKLYDVDGDKIYDYALVK